MIRNNILLILLTLLFTGCVERGHSLQPVHNSSLAKPITNEKKKSVIVPIKKTSINKLNLHTTVKEKAPVVIKQTETKKTVNTVQNDVKKTTITEDTFFTLSHETKNTISGIFVFIIGIMILL